MSGSGSSVFGLSDGTEETDMRRLFPESFLFSGLALGECPFTTSFHKPLNDSIKAKG